MPFGLEGREREENLGTGLTWLVCIINADTLVILCMEVPLVLWHIYKKKIPLNNCRPGIYRLMYHKIWFAYQENFPHIPSFSKQQGIRSLAFFIYLIIDIYLLVLETIVTYPM